MSDLKAPFPYFGGKSKVAKYVWMALGQPKHYIEPFFGSGAVLLSRPNYDSTKHVETICDKDGFVANVWRALKFKPDEVAEWCDWPVNHADLCARRRKLVTNEERLLENLITDEEWCDPKLAGYWIWAASCWIGSGLTRLNAIPDVSKAGAGVHSIGQRPHLSDAGKGVHVIGKRPSLGNTGVGVHTIGQRTCGVFNQNIYDWFRRLSERLRYVRIVCGDWKRVCGGNWQDNLGQVGMFFDPPYGVQDRDTDLYHAESTTIAQDVMRWCLERGDKPTYRIVIAGYEEHAELLDHGWTSMNWKAQGGYSNRNKQGNQNRHRERLYFSPHCNPIPQQEPLVSDSNTICQLGILIQ